MTTTLQSAAILGIDASPIDVEADISQGLPNFIVVGLPDAAIQESRERVRTAIRNSGVPFPRTRVIVNLAPADIRKEGPSYDLAVAAAILSAAGVIPLNDGKRRIIIGELALDGSVRRVSGALPVALLAINGHYDELLIPEGNTEEAGLALDETSATAIIPIKSLASMVAHLKKETTIPSLTLQNTSPLLRLSHEIDMADIHGQQHAKRAVEIAAAGGHNTLLSGPPGSGKTLLARAMPTILPRMARDELLEVTKIHSVAGLIEKKAGVVTDRPFRSPHHSASAAALIGGGSWPRPGEVSLAHRGVLFLDEFPEFPRSVLECLRQPLEDGYVTVSRSQCTVSFPAEFMLVAARNPCPCGHGESTACECTPADLMRYRRRLSGPLMDRIDLHVDVPRIPTEGLMYDVRAECSRDIRDRVKNARERQERRFSGLPIITNSEMGIALLRTFCTLDSAGRTLLESATERLRLSARAYGRILKVGRTIADLDGADTINADHLAEAISYRER